MNDTRYPIALPELAVLISCLVMVKSSGVHRISYCQTFDPLHNVQCASVLDGTEVKIICLLDAGCGWVFTQADFAELNGIQILF